MKTEDGFVRNVSTHSHLNINNPFLISGLVHPYHMYESISSFRGFWFLVDVSIFTVFPQKIE